jgi:hypothetical protein
MNIPHFCYLKERTNGCSLHRSERPSRTPDVRSGDRSAGRQRHQRRYHVDARLQGSSLQLKHQKNSTSLILPT